nr:hypothetical protein [Tanacetum cinerariifolium]
MENPKDISNPKTALDMALELMAKAFQLNNTTPTNNNQRSSSNPCYSQIAQLGMNIDQDRHMLMVDDNGIQNVGNQNRLSVVLGIANQHGNGNVVAAQAQGSLHVSALSGNVEMESDIENMTISEYLEYEAVKERRLWDDVRSGRSPINYNEADVDSLHWNKEPIHTTPPSDDYVAPTTKSILDELLKEFEDEILNVTMVDDEADFNPTKD